MVVLMVAIYVWLIGALLLPAPPAPVTSTTQVQKVDLRAERFAFTPSEIKTTVGTRLEIRLTSDDTAHGFRLVGTTINIEIPKRGKGAAAAVFTPIEPGRYTFECSHVCGAGHGFMRGVIVVTNPVVTK
jgi:cytochrome c oxidase subunit 2